MEIFLRWRCFYQDYNIGKGESMRRLLSIAVVGAVALFGSSAFAQRGMGGGGMRGGGGGFGGARVGGAFRSGPAMGAGFRSGPAMGARFRGPAMGGRMVAPPGRVLVGRPGMAPRGFVGGRPGMFSRGVVAHPRVRSNVRIATFNPALARGHHFFFGNCFNFHCHNPFFRNSFFFGFGNPFFTPFASPFFSPFLGAGYIPGFSYPYDYGYGYPSDYYQQAAQQQPVATDNGASTQLAMQIQQLSDEISDLRGEQALQRIQQNRQVAPGTSMSVVPPAGETTFVFRDGRRVTAENYAISGQTLWVLNEHAAKKYAIADLDQAATEQVNSANGVDVHLPSAAKP